MHSSIIACFESRSTFIDRNYQMQFPCLGPATLVKHSATNPSERHGQLTAKSFQNRSRNAIVTSCLRLVQLLEQSFRVACAESNTISKSGMIKKGVSTTSGASSLFETNVLAKISALAFAFKDYCPFVRNGGMDDTLAFLCRSSRLILHHCLLLLGSLESFSLSSSTYLARSSRKTLSQLVCTA